MDELLESGCEVIALDATTRKRPAEIVQYVHKKAPNIELIADCSTIEDAKIADELGIDYIGTTLHGYTTETKARSYLKMTLPS